jgi:ABC-type multidrug transport system fused ATPase/permease subunit
MLGSRVAAQLELDFNSVERVVEYLDVPQEAPAIIERHRPPAYWPSTSGHVIVENLTIRYAPDLPPALNRVSFEIKSFEKVGVVGRTGSGQSLQDIPQWFLMRCAGKSTLALSLLRMIEPDEGKIMFVSSDPYIVPCLS